MKKTYICILIAIFLIVCFAIFGNVENNKNDNKRNVTTSFYPMYIATINLTDGIEEFEVNNLTQKTTGCVHDYTLTPEEMIKLSTADILVVNGNGMENFLDRVITSYSDLNVVDTSLGLETLEEEHGVNPHTFVSIEKYIMQVENLKKGLVNAFPEYADKISENAEIYITTLNALKYYAHEKLDKFNGEKVIALHEAFEYFADDFGLNVMAVIEEEEGVSASASEITRIMAEAKRNGVRAIVVDKDSNTSTANTISDETGIPIVIFDTTIYGEMEKNSYVDAMRENIDNLENILEEI